MSMSAVRFGVAVILQRTKLANRWIDARWEPIEIVDDSDSSSVPVRVGEDERGTRWRFGGQVIELHRSEAEGYYLNLTSPQPKAFVMWRTNDDGREPGAFPVIVT